MADIATNPDIKQSALTVAQQFMARGRAEGEAIAYRKMKNRGFSLQQIAVVAGMDEEEIERLLEMPTEH